MPKKIFKNAINRNRIKRLIKEVYRLNKNELYKRLENSNKKVQLIIVFIGKKIAAFKEINNSLPKYLNQLVNKICEKNCN